MGCMSSSIKETIDNTQLLPLSPPVVAIHADNISSEPRKLLVKLTRAVVFDNVKYNIHEYGKDTEGELLYWLDGYQVLTDAAKNPLVKFEGNIGTKGFHIVDMRTGLVLFSLARYMRPNLPAEMGRFQDRRSGKEYIIGYTGQWMLEHRAVIWLATPSDPETRTPVAKVYPAGGAGINLKYVMEVAPGMDRTVLLLLCYIFDYAGDELFQPQG